MCGQMAAVLDRLADCITDSYAATAVWQALSAGNCVDFYTRMQR